MQSKTLGPFPYFGDFEVDDRGEKIIVESISSLEERWNKAKLLTCGLNINQKEHVKELRKVFESHQGEIPVKFHLEIPEISKKVLLDWTDGGVNLSTDLFEDLHRVLGSTDSIRLH